MAMSWGGVIGGAIAAGAAGGMSSMAKDIDEQMKAEMQALRDKQLAELARQSHAINTAKDIELRTAAIGSTEAAKAKAEEEQATGRLARKGEELALAADVEVEKQRRIEADKGRTRILPAGSRLIGADGEVLTEAETRKLTPEERDLAIARTEDARSRASKNDRGPAEKPEKPENLKPQKYMPVKGDRSLEYDELTDTYRRTITSVAGKPAKKGIVSSLTGGAISSFEEPEVSAVRGGYEYLDANLKPISEAAVEEKRRERSGYKPQSESTSGAGKKPGAPYPDGMRVRDKSGKMYIVKNGVPVPL